VALTLRLVGGLTVREIAKRLRPARGDRRQVRLGERCLAAGRTGEAAELFRALAADAPTEHQRRLYQRRLAECAAS
jgi:hypothetical protein